MKTGSYKSIVLACKNFKTKNKSWIQWNNSQKLILQLLSPSQKYFTRKDKMFKKHTHRANF